MTHHIWKYVERNTAIFVVITAIILAFYSIIILGVYALILIFMGIGIYLWKIIDLSKFNRWLINIGVVVITFFIMTIMVELWLQLYPHRLTGIDGIDTVGNFSDYISRGYLRNDVFAKRKDVVRILGLGDSFSIYLKDQKKNYTNFLQQQYQAHDKGDVEIVNAGMEAMGPGYYWHILKKYGDLFKPDLVLVGFFIGNDFNEAEFTVFIGNFINEPKSLLKRYSKYYQFRHLRLYKLLQNKSRRYREEQRRTREVKNLPQQQVGTFSQDTFLEIERQKSWIFDKNYHNLLQNKWYECSKLILRMKDWCDRRKITLVIAVLPDQFQVDSELRKAVLRKFKNIREKNLDLSFPDQLIVNFCQLHNINCVDLLGPFQEEGKTRRLYALRDTHWNEAGNRLAADLIYAYLEDHHLLPSRPRP